MTTNNPCTQCGKPGIPGLIRGAGKCQYHWNVGSFGQEWADLIEQERRATITAYYTDRANGAHAAKAP